MDQASEKKPTPNRGSEPLPDDVLDNGTRPAAQKEKEELIEEVTPPENADQSETQPTSETNNEEQQR